MPRLPRLNLPAVFYHVMVRGIERRRIFRRPADYYDFLTRLGANLLDSGCRCFSWALMPNHIHLLILSGVRGIVSLMHPLLTGYATAFNLRHERVGHLFQNRYKAIICEEDPYFLQLLRYIVLNPVRAGMVHTLDELRQYPWTSHRAVMGIATYPWLETNEVLMQFGSSPEQSRFTYERFINEGWSQGKLAHLEGEGALRTLSDRHSDTADSFDSRILGSSLFVDKVHREAEILENVKNQIHQQWTLDSIREAIARERNIDPTAILRRDRQRAIAKARDLFVYAAIDGLGQAGVAVATLLRISGAAVCQARERGRQLAAESQLLKQLKT